MSTVVSEPNDSAIERRCLGRGTVLGLWILTAIPLFIGLGGPVQRTQEGRVVETARQMLGRGPEAWLIPSLNGEIRLRKPPLAYWMAAGSFELFGVSEWTGRIPTALVSWLTLAATYVIARRLFGRTAAIVAAACLLSSYLFFLQGRRAETDAPAALLATIAVDLFWRSVEADASRDPNADALPHVGWAPPTISVEGGQCPPYAVATSPRLNNPVLLFHLAAAATGLSLFSKQGPGFFPILFFIGFALARRQSETLRRFVRSGAPLTLLLVAGWWYGFAALNRGMAQFLKELAEVTEGLDHPAPFYVYFQLTLLAFAPWSFLAGGALVAAIKDARRDPRIAGILIWAAADFVPLCFVGNKQIHYLLPLMPAVMILVGWLVSRAADAAAEEKLKGAVWMLMIITIIGCIVAPLGFPIAGYVYRGKLLPLDVPLAAGAVALGLPALAMYRKRRMVGASLALAGAWSLIFIMALGPWALTIGPADIRQTAAQIAARFGNGPYVFYGGDTSLPLCFALRQEIPRIDDHKPDLLRAAAASEPHLAVIWEIPQHAAPPQIPPPEFVLDPGDFGAKGQHFRIYTRPAGPG
ncbi:MAG: glycosyltransferase family 39 protein [Tepidisphaeraceae bacterium]